MEVVGRKRSRSEMGGFLLKIRMMIMNDLQKVFNYNDCDVRVVMIDNNPWFVAKDVCEILEIKDYSQAVERLKENQRGGCTVPTPGGNQKVLAVTEAGLYRLIFTSRKKEAEAFQDWVCEEVLPSIRRTGQYSTKKQDPFKLIQAEHRQQEIPRPVKDFVTECCIVGVNETVSKKQLHYAYCGWCVRESKMPLSYNAFGRELLEFEASIDTVDVRGKRYWTGLTLDYD